MQTATLMILGRPLTFTTRVSACLIPGDVHPGPCKGHGPGSTITKIAKKAVTPKKAVAKKPASVKPRKLTHEQATAMQQRMLEAEPWTTTQRDALQHYTDEGFVTMNHLLRGGPTRYKTEETPEQTKEYVRAAFHGLRPLPEPIRVFRTTKAVRLGLEETKNRAKFLAGLRSLVGKTHQDRGFSSTTIDELSGEFERFGDVRLDIELPAGTRGAYVEGITVNDGEHEFVVAPGLKLEWTSLDETKNPPVLKARAIP